MLKMWCVLTLNLILLGFSACNNCPSFDIEILKLGCFAENVSNHEFYVSAGNYDSESLTPHLCAYRCGEMGFDFAALQNGKFCFCSQRFGNYGASVMCNKTCSGNEKLYCGGPEANSVYNASYYQNKVEVLASGEWKLFYPINVTTKVQNSPETSFVFAGDFKDVSLPSVRGWQSYTPTVSGNFVVKTKLAREGLVQDAVLQTYITAAVKHVFLECPSVIATEEEFYCLIRVYQGTEVNATLLTGEQNNISIFLPDPVPGRIGVAVPQWQILGAGSNHTGMFVMVAEQSKSEAMVIALEIFGHTPGKIKTFVARPSCDPTTEHFCLYNGSCISKSEECLTEDYKACNGFDLFCSSHNCCYDPSKNNCSISSAKSTTTLPLLKHTVVHVLKPVTVEKGYNLYVLGESEAFRVAIGDTIGWVSDGQGMVAHLADETKTYQVQGLSSNDVKIGMTVNTTNNIQVINARYLMSFISAESATFAFKHKPLGMPGIHTVHAKLWSSQTETSASSLAVFHVQKPLTFLTPDYIHGIEMFVVWLNRSTEVAVNISPATNVTIAWYQASSSGKVLVRHQNVKDFQSRDTMKVSFSSKGTHELYVKASNNVSSANATITVLVLNDNPSGLTADLANTTEKVYKGISVFFNASVAHGSHVKYKWIFDETQTNFLEKAHQAYCFTRCGVANVTVIATNFVSEVRASFTVLVHDPISIQGPAWGTVNDTVHLKCALVEHSTIRPLFLRDYVWQFDDGHQQNKFRTDIVTHKFITAGIHSVSCSYNHNAFAMIANKQILILEPVAGLRIKNVSAVELYNKKTFEALTLSGNNLTYEWHLQSGNESFIELFLGTNNAIEYQFNATGLYWITVNVSNLISWASDSVSFQVQQCINGLGITSYPNPAPSNSTITFNVTKGTGSNVTYRLDFGDGFITQSFGDLYVFQRTFLSGAWLVILTGKNAVSHMIIFHNVTVQDPISEINVTVLNGRWFHDRHVMPVGEPIQILCEVSDGTSVYFRAYYDTERNPKVYKEYPGKRRPTGGVYATLTHTFQRKGMYNVTVVGKNLISRNSSWIVLQAQENIQGLSLTMPGYAITRESFDLSFRPVKGSNVTYFVNFGDGSPNVTTSVTSLSHTYKSPRVSRVTITASNQLNTVTIQKTVVTQNRIKGLEFAKFSETASLYNPLAITWKIDSGSNVTYIVDFGDGSTPLNISLDMVGTELYANYTYRLLGKYTIIITAYNMARSNQTISTTVEVEEPVSGFFAYASSHSISLFSQVEIHTQLSQGSSVTYHFDFKDGSPEVDTTQPSVSHRYKVPGNFSPSVRVANKVSSVTVSVNSSITVERPLEPLKIEDLAVLCEPTILGNISSIRIEFFSGYLFQCTVDYGDNTEEKVNDSELRVPLRHRYQKTGSFRVFVHCSNKKGISEASSFAIVDTEIIGLNFTESVMYVMYGDTITIKWTWKSGTNIQFHLFLDEKRITNIEVNLAERSGFALINPRYIKSPGVYIFLLNASNSVTAVKTVILRVHFQTKLEGLWIDFNPFSRVGLPLVIYASCTSGSQLNFLWEFGENNATYMERQTDNDVRQFSANHTYTKSGVYTLTVLAWNYASRERLSQNVTIMNPVKDYLLSQNNIVYWPNSTVKFTLERRNITVSPDQAQYEFDYGNGIKSGTVELDATSTSFEHIYDYPSAGCYEVKVILYNLVSRLTINAQVQIIRKIEELKIVPMNSIDNDNPLSPGAGVRFNVFPSNYPVRLEARHTQGTCVKYEWTFNNSLAKSTTHFAIEYKFPSSGYYLVGVKANNSISTLQYGTYIVLKETVVGLFLANTSPAKAGNRVTFVLFCKQRGQDTTFVADFDGTTITLPVPKKNNTTEFKALLNLLSTIPFKHTNYFTTVFDYIFSNNGVYRVIVRAWNEASQQTATTKVVITDKECPLPRVTILGGGKNFNSTPKMLFSKPLTLMSEVQSHCEGEYNISYKWVLYKTTFYQETSSNYTLPPSASCKISLPRNLQVDLPSIIVPKSTLKPGFYTFELTITTYATGLTNVDYSYVKLADPGIFAHIAGGNLRSNSWDTQLVLNASESRDAANSSSNVNSLVFYWFCRQQNLSKIQIGNGGCFGNGEGLIEFIGPVFTLRAKTLYENIIYVFTVNVSSSDDPSRNATASQTVIVLSGKPLNINIRCKTNCATKMTPSENFVLETSCSGCNKSRSLSYKWTLMTTNGSSAPKLWPNYTMTSQTSPNLVLLPGALTGGKSFAFRVEAKEGNGVSGFAQYNITTNLSPHGGSCDVTPREGVSLQTRFNITCEGWQDNDRPLHYELLFARIDIDSSEVYTLVKHSPLPFFTGIVLQHGNETYNYTLKLRIRSKDAYGTWNKSDLLIKVLPFEDADIVAEANNLFAAGGALYKALGKKDIQESTQLISALASAINEPRNSSLGNNMTQNFPKIRELMVKSLARLPVIDLQSLELAASALRVTTKIPSQLSIDAQGSAADLFTQLSQVLMKEAKEGVDGSMIEHVAREEVSGQSHVLKASSMNVKTLVSAGQEPKNNQVVTKLLSALDQAGDSILYSKISGEKTSVLKTSDITMVMGKYFPREIPVDQFSWGSKAAFTLPPSSVLLSEEDCSKLPYVTLTITEVSANPYSGSTTSELIKSAALSLVIKEPSGNKLNISELQSDIVFRIQQSKRLQQQSNNMTQTPPDDGSMTYHRITLPHKEDSLHVELNISNSNESILVLVRYGHRPTVDQYDYETVIPGNNIMVGNWNNSDPDVYKMFLSSDVVKEAGSYYIGVLPLSTRNKTQKAVIHTVDYTLNVFSSGCYYWDESEFVWSGAGCKVGNQSTYHVTQCKCNHLTWFGADLFIPPNKLDIADATSRLGAPEDYPALLATFCVIIGLYIMALVWARRKDSQDLDKVGLVPVSDNKPDDYYRYEITVYTGMRKNCGTTANVSIILAGEERRTSCYTLKGDYRGVFEAGGVNSFLVTTSESLGSLTCIRIWHDNSGNSPSWFLSQVIIKDVQTDDFFYFLCDRWLACDEDDGQVDHLLPLASKEELGEFTHLFKSKARRDFSDGHLWFSIAFRPPRSRFTRMQRVSCCVTLLLSSMLANVMWYKSEVSKRNETLFDLGFLQFSWHEVLIGIQSSLIVFPINLLIVQIFRHINISPKRKEQYLLNSVKEKNKPCHSTNGTTKHFVPYETRKESTVSLKDIKTTHERSSNISPKEILSPPFYANLNKKSFKQKKSVDAMKQICRFDDEDELFVRLLDSLQEELDAGSKNLGNDVIPKQYSYPDYLSSDLFYYNTENNPNQVTDEKATFNSSIDSPGSNKPLIPPKTKKRTFAKTQKLLPWWFVYVAWVLCLSTAAVAGFFTLLYGVTFPRQKQEAWLLSFFISIVQDIFISQPLKVIGVAVFFALLIGRPQEEDDAQITSQLAQDGEWLKQNIAQTRKETVNSSEGKLQHPPDEMMLRTAREIRLKERKMYSIIREIIFYFLFVVVVLTIAYGDRDPYARFMTENLREMFVGHGEIGEELEGGRGQRSSADSKEKTKFIKVNDAQGFWRWLEEDLVPGLYNGNWYNNVQDTRDFLADRTNFLVGGARLRQLRVKKDTCQVAKIFQSQSESLFGSCNAPYSWSTEYIHPNHYPGWIPTNHSLPKTSTYLPWHYQKSTDLLTYPFMGILSIYKGGGYVVELGKNVTKAIKVINDLKSNGWIDKYSRAVFMEFTVYNANNNLYCVLNLLLEFTAAGGGLPFLQILAMRIDRYVGSFQLFILACEISFVLFTVLFTYREIRRMIKSQFKEYVSEFWTWMEIAQLSLSWAVIALYFIRLGDYRAIKKQFSTNPVKFINHLHLATTDRVYGYIYAAVVFLMSVKFLRLFRFNRRMSLLGSVIRQSSKELCHFLIIWGIVFLAFAHFSYMVFSRELHKFHTFIGTSETLVSVMLGKFSYQNLERSNRVLGPLMFFLYSLSVVFILMNMFVSIIIENFKRVKRDNDLQSNEYEIVDFMIEQLKSLLGVSSWSIRRRNRVGASSKPKDKQKSKVYKDEELKEKIDRMINLIRIIHFDNEEDDGFLRNDGEITYKVS